MKKYLYSVHWMLPVIFTFSLNNMIYFGTRPFMEGRYHYNLSSAIDEWIPFMSEFIVICFGCYLFWVVNY